MSAHSTATVAREFHALRSEQVRRTAPPPMSLSSEDLAAIELIQRGDLAVGGPAPEAMPRR